MAMRLYSCDDFEAELKEKWKLTPTDTTTAQTRMWKTPKGRHISIPSLPQGERYPDCYIDLLVERLDALGENPLKPPNKHLTEKDIFYFRQRNKNKIFQTLIAYFADRAQFCALTKSDVARNLGKDPAQVTRWFSGPGNWTLDTISDLVLAMNGDLSFEITPMRIREMPLTNNTTNDLKGLPSTRAAIIKTEAMFT